MKSWRISHKPLKKILKELPYKPHSFKFSSNLYYSIEKIRCYVPDLWRILPRWLNIICFSYFIIQRKDFQHLINSSLNCQELKIINCNLDFEDIIIDKKNKSRIKVLDFHGSGAKRKSNWEEHPYKFRNIIKAISESDIKHSLQKICISFEEFL